MVLAEFRRLLRRVPHLKEIIGTSKIITFWSIVLSFASTKRKYQRKVTAARNSLKIFVDR